MSTQNIGFYEEMAKIIFQLSFKYAPYLFFWFYCEIQRSMLSFTYINQINNFHKNVIEFI